MKRLMGDILAAMSWSEDEAEEICASMGIKEVLQGLRGEEVWLRYSVVERRRVRLQKENWVDAALQQAQQGEEMDVKVNSPKVELVEESMEADEELESGIEIYHEDPVLVQPINKATTAKMDKEDIYTSSPVPISSAPTSTTTTSLGKRKSPPADLASKNGDDVPHPIRQARGPVGAASRDDPITFRTAETDNTISLTTSASNTTATTATSTSSPEDVVMPVTPEDENGVETLRNYISEMSRKASHPADESTGNGDGNMEVGVDDDELLEDGEEDLDGSSINSLESIDVGRGAGGHYEEQYATGDEEEDFEDEDDMGDEYEESEALERQQAIKEEEEEEEQNEKRYRGRATKSKLANNCNGNKRSYTPSNDNDDTSSAYDDDESVLSSTTSTRSILDGPPLPYPRDNDLNTSICHIPYIPMPDTDDPDDEVGKFLAKDAIMAIWFDARASLRVCRCKICGRGNGVDADIGKIMK